MKIKVRNLPYEEVMKLPVSKHIPPQKQGLFFRTFVRLLSGPELKKVNFRYDTYEMEKLDKDEPALFLMNHSSFLDLKIAFRMLYPRPFHIVCTSDGFVGKDWLMRRLGCIPTKKFMTDITLVRDMVYAVQELKSSVLMYPEASYSFDGTATPLPESLGKCLKILGVPVVMIQTFGAFARDPLYNNLQVRNTDVSARMDYILTPEEIREKSVEELNDILKKHFTFDHFRWQKEHQVAIRESFRADGLNRVLYKCPHCLEEGSMEGAGIHLTCKKCGKTWELSEYGELVADEGDVYFTHIPDWYQWERECVRQELLNGSYCLDLEVTICMMKDMKCIYRVGIGRLHHDRDGFTLTGCDGKLKVRMSPEASYSLYSDYFWYEIGDMICIGDRKILY